MKAKIFTLFLAVILATTFVLALADISISPSELLFNEDQETKDFTITNIVNESATLDYALPSAITQGSNSATFTLVTSPGTINALDTQDVTVKLNGNPNDFNFGKYTGTLVVTATGDVSNETATSQVDLSFSSSFCSNGAIVDIEDSDMTIDDIEINVDIQNNGEGDDDKWEFFDEVEIEVKVENNHNDDDFEDAMIEIGLFDSSGNDVADDLDYFSTDDEEVDVGDIRDDDEEEWLFEFRVPADFEEGNYKLAVKVYSDKEGESSACVDSTDDFPSENDRLFDIIDIESVNDEDRFVVVDDIVMDSEATCGETVSGSFTLFNIGDEDQDRIEILMKSAGLDVDQTLETTNLDEGDDEDFSFIFTVPEGTDNTLHTLEFRTRYDYRNGVYREQSKDTFTGFINILGCSTSTTTPEPPATSGPQIAVDATLFSGGLAGDELVISATLTNFGDQPETVTIDGQAYESWGDLSSLSPKVLNLAPGESRSSTFVFDVKEDLETGPQSFVVETRTSTGQIMTQEVGVDIQGTSGTSGVTGFSVSGLFGEGSSLIWLIVLINIILIILIIVVAVRLSRR